MKKFLMGVLAVSFLLMLTVSTVSAFCMLVPSSYRGSGGTLNYIGDSNYDTDLTPSKIKLSYWTQEGYNGEGSLQIIARDSEGKRVVLNLHFDQYQSYLYSIDGKFYVHFGATGRGTYWKTGVGRVSVNFSHIYYDYEIGAELTDIYGYGSDGINFRVEDIPTKGIA